MNTTIYNAEGAQVYSPQPGEYWKAGLRYRESFGGVVAVLNDVIVENGGTPGQYPSNFAGIIEAIRDLGQYITDKDNTPTGPTPPNWDVIVDPITGDITGDWITNPTDGALWFDTRQGRLFIAVDGNYWQTNGGDGLAHVGAEAPTNPPVIGSTWFDTENELLYVFVGNGLWEIVKGAGEVSLTTATLPLAIARSTFDIYEPNIIPKIDSTTMEVQKDFNEYIYAAAVALDQAVTQGTVTISDAPPTENVVEGTLWYDSSTLELSVWYEDDDSAQWVPTSVSYSFDSDLATLSLRVDNEERAREAAVAGLFNTINEIRRDDIPDISILESKVAKLEQQSNNPVIADMTGYLDEAALETKVAELTEHINTVNARIPDVSYHVTTDTLNALEAAVNLLPTTDYVTTAIAASQPDLTSFVSQAEIDSSISNITTDYLPRTGGTLTGSFISQRADIGYAAFDFSSSKPYSKNTHKYRTNSLDTHYAKFGTNDNQWEYAWDFSSNEDFCWVYGDSSKVFSITKDGPACSQLYLGDFGENTTDGRVLHNKIDVKDRLTTYQSTFETLRQSVANATDFDELKANILTALANV